MSAARDALSDEAAAAKRRAEELEAKAPAAFFFPRQPRAEHAPTTGGEFKSFRPAFGFARALLLVHRRGAYSLYLVLHVYRQRHLLLRAF